MGLALRGLAMAEQTKRYLRFRVGHQWYGIDVDNIIEVLNFMLLTELPGVAPDVLGLMTLRDMVMPVLDLRLRFGILNPALQLDSPVIAVHSSRGPIGLVVDDIDDLEDVQESQIAPHNDETTPYVTGFARLPDHLMLLLDASLLRTEVLVS
jgi:purine-binding chemotaxis protein CheW